MKQLLLKRSAVHNLVITHTVGTPLKDEISEGLVIAEEIMEKADIAPWEQIIVTNINGTNWSNRLKTFAIPGKQEGVIELRGSMLKFLKPKDMICLITYTMLNEKNMEKYKNSGLPIFDLGLDPKKNTNNIIPSHLDIEFNSHKIRDVKQYNKYKNIRKIVPRFMLSSLVLNLKINKTHPDCLQGSAELPSDIMDKAGMLKYQAVTVYNGTIGGAAETYAIPMPPKVVMTTGAMARFAPIGSIVNVATYSIDYNLIQPTIVVTDGEEYLSIIENDNAV